MLIEMLAIIIDQPIDIHRAVWPARVSFRSVLVTDLERQRVDLAIRDASRQRILYRLICGSGMDDDNPEDFSGLIMCKLVSTNRMQNPRNLLSLERSLAGKSWDMRGRFLEQEIVGRCGNMPAWGRSRAFDIGLLRMELRISDVVVDRAGRIRSYSFAAEVRNRNRRDLPLRTPRQPHWFGSGLPCPI